MGNVSRFKNSSPTFRPMTAGGKPSKKRAAPSQIGPKSKKKIHPETPPKKDERPSVVKRGRPVTLPQTHDSDTSSDEEAENLSGEDEGAESVDEDEEMPDASTKDPNGGCRALASGLKIIDGSTVQLQERHTKHRRFSSTNAKLQSLMLHYFKTLNAYGILPGRKTLAQSERNTSPIL